MIVQHQFMALASKFMAAAAHQCTSIFIFLPEKLNLLIVKAQCKQLAIEGVGAALRVPHDEAKINFVRFIIFIILYLMTDCNE